MTSKKLCSVKYCRNNGKDFPHLVFHRFPSNEKMYVNIIGRQIGY